MKACVSRLLVLGCVLSLAGAPASARRGDIEIVEIHSTRQEGTIGFSGTVKVTASKPVNGLIIRFEFFDPGGVLLTIQKQVIEEGVVESGDEVRFDLEGRDIPRAVTYRVLMTNGRGRDLKVSGGGPFPLG